MFLHKNRQQNHRKKTSKNTLELGEKTIDDDDEPKNRLKTARGPLPETPFSAPSPFWDDFGVPEGSPKSAPGASELLPIFRRIPRCPRNAPEGRFLGFWAASGASGASPGTPPRPNFGSIWGDFGFIFGTHFGSCFLTCFSGSALCCHGCCHFSWQF